MDERSSLSQLLARARRRCLAHLVLNQSALALTIAMGGAVLLLLAGTQILDWYWVVLLAVASLGVGLYRLRKTIPSTYKLAQRIDHRLNLADTLSTAAHFSLKSARGNEAIRQRQRREAEAVARTVEVRQGLPFSRPRYLVPAIALAAVALGLFALRYGMTGSLSLQSSLVRIALDTFFPTKPELAAANRKNSSDRLNPQIDPSSPDSPTTLEDASPDSVPDTVEDPNADPAGQDKAKSPDANNQDPSDDSDKGDNPGLENDSNKDKGPEGDNSKDGKQQNAKQDSKPGSDKQESMLDKLRDAMSNMLAKMNSKKEQSSKKGQQNGQPDKSNQKNSQSEKNQSDDASAQGDQQQGDAADKQQSADAGIEKGSDNKASQDSKSGIGSAEGDKRAKEAQELAAMGKISEILGKRSANVSGEVMVEVGSSKQQLKTPWAQRQATHAEAGSEIHRDEIPLMYQQFVQQYFEEIRKIPEADSSAKPAGAKPPRKTTKRS